VRVKAWKKRTVKPSDWRASNVPEGKAEARLDLIPSHLPFVKKTKEYLDALKENVQRGRGLVLWGPYRGGKSCLAACVVGEAMSYRLNAYWIFSFDVADAWIARGGWRKAEIRGTDFLVIDDLGMESQDSVRGEFPREKIKNLLRVRLEGARPTIVTTNLSPENVKKIYGEKTWALLEEKMTFVLVSGAEQHWKERQWERD